MTYLERLALELILGLAGTPESVRAPHVAYLHRSQQPDGGWAGREGPSDLYYTGFALRGLAVLDALSAEVRDRAGRFLRHRLSQGASVVDFFSFLYSAGLLQAAGGPNLLADFASGWEERTAAELNAFQSPDGGYAKLPGTTTGSTYHTFLVVLCHELIARPLPNPARVLPFIHSRRRDDGGFVEIGPMKRSGTNPTAAAVAVLRMLEPNWSGDPAAADCLAGMVVPEGGVRANGRIPAADLLSTFTCLWTMGELQATQRVQPGPMRHFVQALAHPQGGFRAGLWDAEVDVEYTFYGLGVLGLLETQWS